MSFVANDVGSEQLSLFDSFATLTDREKRFLNKSWAKYFAENIFPKIDEQPYAVLYSKKDSRPNTPVNVQVGALIIKEFTNLSDDEILTALMFDVRFQYALHTTSFTEQPLNDRTLGRFRERCATYEKETGIDLLHATISSLSKEMAEMMKLDFSLKSLDSASRFHLESMLGCILFEEAISFIVRSPLNASSTSWAFSSGVCCFLAISWSPFMVKIIGEIQLRINDFFV